MVEDFVSLTERLRALFWVRTVIAVIVLAATLVVVDGRWTAYAVLAGWFGLTLALDLRVRTKLRNNVRPSWRELVPPMLAESVATVIAVYLGGGATSPVRYALVLQGMSTALLLSHKIAIRNAVWVSLLVLVSHEIQELGLVNVVDELDGKRLSTSPELFALLIAVWGATLLTGSASAVNERGLRRERLEQQIHASFGRTVEEARGPRETAAALAAHVMRTGTMQTVLVVGLRPEPTVLSHVGTIRDIPSPPSTREGSLLHEMISQRRPIQLRSLRAGEDPELHEMLDDPQFISAVPLITGDDVVGAVVVVHGPAASRGVPRRTIVAQQRLAAHGALALANAWVAEALDVQASTDGLTGVANRRVFDERLALELDRARRKRSPLSLLLADVDSFKVFNDMYGHQAGDDALVDVAAALTEGRRPYDLVARYGGEEFVIILPHTDHQEAMLVAERLRRAVQERRDERPVTASFGVATVLDGLAEPPDVLRTADRCLYRAKDAGRNRVEGELTHLFEPAEGEAER